jgi:hypothetical protein
LMNSGSGDLDHSAIVTMIEGMAGCEVCKPAKAALCALRFKLFF